MPQTMSLFTRHRSFTVWLCALSAALWSACACAQFAPSASPPAAAPAATAPPVVALPEPIYWKHDLFLIPYQWSSAADPSAAQAVWLLVSKDRGASWQKISEARPQVKAFNYRAEGEGEYWFAIRTIDRKGQPQPAEPYRAELRVIVDTTMPRIDSLAAQLRGDGVLQIQTRANDLNLDTASWKFEAQFNTSDTWQPLAGMTMTPDGQAMWQPPAGARPRSLRATVYDRAGNSAAYGATITGAPVGSSAAGAATSASTTTISQGWVSASDVPHTASAPAGSSAPQQWPTATVAQTPFRLSDGAAAAPGDRVTSYGNPLGVGTPLVVANDFADQKTLNQSTASRDAGTIAQQGAAPDNSPTSAITPLEPYREATQPFRHASLTRLPAIDGTSSRPTAQLSAASSEGVAASTPPRPVWQLPLGVEAKHVGSRTFALEYDLEDFGHAGIAKVELWGTRDGGQTWRLFATDDDHRSPLIATVDNPGIYGFRIVVESAGGTPAIPPGPGVAPELWIDVDLSQPTAEITSVQLGAGNLADHLILNWRADDDNLDPRPISLFYSSRAAGPWTAISTNLENSGEYAWQLQRHLPDRFYLRLEARDVAGNLAAFQTREPVVLPTSPPTAQLRDVRSIAP
jgi:hypothetical protein